MKNIDRLSIILLLAIMLSACKKDPVYFGNSLTIFEPDEVDHMEMIVGVPVVNEAIGAYSINVVDTMICVANRNTEFKFSIYNLNGDSITSVGRTGQGPSDFTSNRMNRQKVVTDSSAFIWVIDVNASLLKRLNLTLSTEMNESCVDSMIQIRPMVMNAFVTGDTIIQELMNDRNYEIFLSDRDGTQLFQESMYNHDVDPSRLFMFYNGKMGLSPDGRYLVTAMSAINQINIMDLKNGYKRHSVSIGGVNDPDAIFNNKTETAVWTYYSNVTLGDKFIYALYENQPYDTKDIERSNGELHVLDYAGNVVCIVPLDRALYSISYSDKDNCIYALDEKETVCRYNLSSIIK